MNFSLSPKLYFRLQPMLLTEDQLVRNGFPRMHPFGPLGRAKTHEMTRRALNINTITSNQRICDRCKMRFLVNIKGFSEHEAKCQYHWGTKTDIKGKIKWDCCHRPAKSGGCTTAKCHVWDYMDVQKLFSYEHTLSKRIEMPMQGIFAINCKMAYGCQGLELTEVAIINVGLQIAYHTYVTPRYPIVDYNTCITGITEDSMKDATTFDIARRQVLKMIGLHTILIGHHMDEHLHALKIIHNSIIDTAIYFPPTNGPFHKKSLSNLCRKILHKTLDPQTPNCVEEAKACMELMLWRTEHRRADLEEYLD